MSVKNNSNEFTLTRLYEAPLKLVWEAWTDLEQVSKWWGPRGFTLTTHSKDLKSGGHWHYTMHGPDGTDYPNKTVYHAVEEYKRLVYDHGANDEQPPLFRVTVLFKEIGSKTQLEFTMTCASPEKAKEIQKFIKQANGNSTWDRLAEYLAKKASNKDVFVINRSFDVDIETMFEAWTDPKQVVKWSGPVGAQMEYINVEIKTGGKAFYKMPFGDQVIYGTVQYLEIKRPDRLVYIQQFANEDGSPGRHPMAPEWPQSMLTTIQFAEEDDGKTRITLQWEVSGEWTPMEMETFLKGRLSMTLGWSGSFDKLEEYFACMN